MIHEMKLQNVPYELIESGIKTVELRLNDEKRKRISKGDTILFTNIKTQKSLSAKVENLHYADSFTELFEKIADKKSLGFLDEDKSVEEMVQDMRAYYSEVSEKEWGVVGIEIKTLKA